jgi:hypothetical protein
MRTQGHLPPLPHFRRLAAFLLAAAILPVAGCMSADDDDDGERHVGSLRLIGQQVLPRRMSVQGTVVGGLSGIDYDARSGRYVLISDDRTSTDSPNPPRLYEVTLTFDASSFGGVQFQGVTVLKQPGGAEYPKVPDPRVADPESVRIDPATGNLVWASEGDRSLAATPPRLIDPFVREVTRAGEHVREYALPPMFRMASAEQGPRGNLVFEGLSFTPDGRELVVITEGARHEDGLPPTVSAGSVSRITVFDRASGQATAQFVYPIERVQATPVPAEAFTVNGPTEIVALGGGRFLVLERSFSVGVVGNQVRLYEIDTTQATNVLSRASLTGGGFTAVTKRLLLDFNSLASALGGIANLEGMTFGPRLPNGNETLVVVADDNFPAADSATDRNQILVFEVLR